MDNLKMMSSELSSNESNIIGTLERELRHEYTRVRRSAVERAGQMLDAGQYSLQVQNLLELVAINDPNLSIREQAQKVLEKHDPKANPARKVSASGQQIIEVRCSLGHSSTFDKHELFENLGRYWRRSILRDDLPLQELVLTCQTCGEDIIIALDFSSFD